MVPPTGVSDSTLVIRRNGASVESCNGALSPRIKNYSMESNDGRSNKNWGEKRKFNKPGKISVENQMIETSNFMVHPDYLNKYGTLSNGVLTKSIKYAETWFYGTVGVRGGLSPRPSLFLYPGVVAPSSRTVNQSSYLTVPSAFSGLPAVGYTPSDRGSYYRRPPDSCFGDRESRQCTDCGRDIRSPGFCRKCGEKRTGSCRGVLSKNFASSDESARARTKKTIPASDPYNLMRKSRLGEGKMVRSSILHPALSQKKFRTPSASPSRRISKEPVNFTFETFKPKEQEKEEKSWENSENNWIKEEEVGRRKSILECDLNAYELNKSRSESKEDEDSIEDFGDSFSFDSELKVMRPKSSKSDTEKNAEEKSEKQNSQKETPKNSEVRLNGQRFKIFDLSNPSTSVVEGYVSDEEDFHSKPEPAAPPALSPKRPPRRAKAKAPLEMTFRYSKSKSKSSPNLSIKSILKKPPSGDDASVADFEVLDDESSDGRRFLDASESIFQSPPPVGKKQSQSTLKKKKQVQFRVNGSSESLSQTQNTTTTENSVEGEAGAPENSSRRLLSRSKSCENLLLVTEGTHEGEAENDGRCPDGGVSDARGQINVFPEKVTGHFPEEEFSLKRNHPHRRSSLTVLPPKNDLFSLPDTTFSKENLFNDTMALRKLPGRSNAAFAFMDEENNVKDVSKNHEPDLLFCKADELNNVEDMMNAADITSGTSFEGSNTEGKVCLSVEAKPLTPNPPPRQSSSTKTKKIKNSGATSVRITSETSTENEEDESQWNGKGKNINSFSSSNFELHSVLNVATGKKECKTVVELGNSTQKQIHELVDREEKGTSIVIHTENVINESPNEPRRKTSVIINNFDPKDNNKVRISVRNEPSDEDSNPSTCTIIETGSNSTVIPVVSADNKTTLIVGNSPSLTPLPVPESNFSISSPQSEISHPTISSQYIFSKGHTDIRKPVEFLDPVEAVRRNLVPHICGKEDTEPTSMENIKESRETKDPKRSIQNFQLNRNITDNQEVSSSAHSTQFLVPSQRFKCWKPIGQNLKFEEGSSTNTSRSNSFSSTANSSLKNSSGQTSRSSSFRSYCSKNIEDGINTENVSPLPRIKCKFYIHSDMEELPGQEKDKVEYEYEITNDLKNEPKYDDENIYETIKEEPFYEKIRTNKDIEESDEDDLPPPLPLTSPPSLEETDKKSAKSIFEGASKYDILNYLVDAKERVKEEEYFSESSIGEEIDSRSPVSSEKSKNISKAANVSCPDPLPKSVSGEDKAGNHKKIKAEMGENDSGIESGCRINHTNQVSYSSDDNITLAFDRNTLKLARKSSAEIERNDSGVGSETSHTSRSKWQSSAATREDPRHLCEDCDQAVETQVTDGGVMYAPLVCRKCSKRRSERKEIIQEIVETEEKYGRDLKIILEEFYTPMLVAGLLAPDQLSSIFLNTEELLENSEQLTEKLRDALDIAFEQGDEDLLTVNVGKLFLEAGPMLHSFESYCTRQGAAALLLANLEKEKELLRIFLRVSQMENAVLRRMNLNSFLMVPVQRVTKYPLLLARLYKVTPLQQEGRELLKEAQHNIELHLEHMNSEAKDVSAAKVWRRFSTSSANGRKSTAELEMINIKLRKMAVDVLDWNHDEVRFVMEGKLLYSQPADCNWKRGRTIKLTPVFVLLATLGKPNSKYKVDPPEDELTFPAKTGVREATLLLVKEKCGRYSLVREPLYLDKIIVCCETDVDEYFEVQELSTKDSFIFKAEDAERTKEWYRYLQYHAQILGSWRKRRNALANIMINGMMARAYSS